MKNEITIEKLKSIIENSIWAGLADKSELYDKYYGIIENLLLGLNREIIIKDLQSLDGLTDKDSFDIFLRTCSSEELDKRFYAITTELRTWKLHIVDDVELAATKSLIKSKSKISKIFIGSLIMFALAAFTLLVVSLHFNDDLCGKVSTVLGGLDFVFGIVFFCYEFISDKKYEKVVSEAEKAKEGVEINEFVNNGLLIGKQINKNKGDVIYGNKIVKGK